MPRHGSVEEITMLATSAPVPTRRAFLLGAAAASGALVIGLTVDFKGVMAAAPAAGPNPPADPNAFIRIAPDDTVTVIVKHLDKGQGVTTGFATIVADELDADWAQMRTEFAPADSKRYNNLFWGPAQGTGGSTSVANSWTQLRKAGAAARAMLVEAAAAEWGVPAGEIRVAGGELSHSSGRSGRFGAFATKAAGLPVPQEPRLKDPSQWVYIGKQVARLDSVEKTSGRAIYGLDVRRPGMLTAVVAHPPLFGARLATLDDAKARAVPGVVDVVRIPTGVAVVAKDTWSAMKGREALGLTWDDSRAEKRSTDVILGDYRASAARPGLVAATRGDAPVAIGRASRVIEAEFTFPYLAHAAMEPMNGTVARNPDGSYEAWGGFQIQTIDQATVAAILGVSPDKVKLNTVWAGGSFGRRATPQADWIAEAAHILKATGEKAPIHLVWTREDDMMAGYYRPMVLHKVQVGLDARGSISGWDHVIVGKSILMGTPFEAMMIKNGVDATSVEGASDTAYALPALRVSVHNAKEAVPVLWWRSVGHTHTAHVVETLVDEAAHAAGQDPVAYRLALLKDAPRQTAVLRLAAEKAGWGEPLPKGRGRGVSVHESFGSCVAMVADVSAGEGGIRVERIVAAVDCGLPINPDVIRAQIEGSVGFALSAVLRNRITLKDGAVQETNFDSYAPTRMGEMPRVEVHIIPSEQPPTGIGEPGVPTIAPAIGNAVFAATGRRLRSLPLDLESLKGV
jgi:isoquinoline 1-oxidoreductase beta subunit